MNKKIIIILSLMMIVLWVWMVFAFWPTVSEDGKRVSTINNNMTVLEIEEMNNSKEWNERDVSEIAVREEREIELENVNAKYSVMVDSILMSKAENEEKNRVIREDKKTLELEKKSLGLK